MYHQFEDKRDLFAEVVEVVEAGVTERMATRVVEGGATGAADALVTGVDAWLDIASEPEVRRILLLDGPVVLGPRAFREVLLRHGLGLTESLLVAAMDAGDLVRLPTEALAQILLGALNEAAMRVAEAEDPAAARAEAREILLAVVEGLRP